MKYLIRTREPGLVNVIFTLSIAIFMQIHVPNDRSSPMADCCVLMYNISFCKLPMRRSAPSTPAQWHSICDVRRWSHGKWRMRILIGYKIIDLTSFDRRRRLCGGIWEEYRMFDLLLCRFFLNPSYPPKWHINRKLVSRRVKWAIIQANKA